MNGVFGKIYIYEKIKSRVCRRNCSVRCNSDIPPAGAVQSDEGSRLPTAMRY